MKTLTFERIVLAVLTTLLLAGGLPALHAQTYTVLYNFGFVTCDPGFPTNAGVIAQGRDGNFYSTAPYGGCYNAGAGYKFTPGGTLTNIHSFDNGAGDGEWPYSGLTLGTSGNYWGTTFGGGANNGGTIFTLTSTGTIDVLYNFCSQTNCTDGGEPTAPPGAG